MAFTGESSALGLNRGRALNALIASVFVTIGFTMVWDPIPASWAIIAGLGFTGLLFWVGTTARHVWAWACLFLGLESLSWPALQFIKLRMANASPDEDQLVSVMGNAFLGIFFATFWLTFAYGIFRWIRRTESAEGTSPTP